MTGSPALPVFLLGGSTGALAVARELDARGVVVHLSLRGSRPELKTRAAKARHPYRTGAEAAELWRRLLLEETPVGTRFVVLACDDDGVEFIAANHVALGERHMLDIARREHLVAFLDKQLTAELMRGTGIHVPKVWQITDALDPEAVVREARGPVLVKPLHSHLFQRTFGTGGRKYFKVGDAEELRASLEKVRSAGIDALLMELIPGPDRNSTTYYGYRGGDGRTLFEFTKRIVRRHPRNEGPGSLHVVQWDEECVRESRKLLDAVDFRGYANIEFKRDERDGRLVLIELNPRFTASQELLCRSGIPAATVVYEHLCGRSVTPLGRPREGLLLWDPVRDFRAYREHRRAEGLTFPAWLESLRGERVHFLFRWRDPRPAFARVGQIVRRGLEH